MVYARSTEDYMPRTSPVQTRVAQSLSSARSEFGATLDQAAASGVPARSVQALEHERQANVQLEHVVALCRQYDVDLAVVLQGWKADSAMPWDMRPRWESPEYVELDGRVRDRLRSKRLAKGTGYKRLASDAKVHTSWIVRIESGEVERIDLVRLERVATALDCTLWDFLA